jgi:hypothetical protein
LEKGPAVGGCGEVVVVFVFVVESAVGEGRDGDGVSFWLLLGGGAVKRIGIVVRSGG